MNVVFVTGATGLLGRSVVSRFLQTDESVRLKLLIRAASDGQLRSRMDRLLGHLTSTLHNPNIREHVEGIRGDIVLPGMGLPDKEYRDLARSVKGIVHIAASTAWDLPLEELRRANTVGTHNVAELARVATMEGSLEYFAHVSTAYVAGDRRGVIRETELSEGQGFNNDYERSKFEAETFVQELKHEVPTIIFRPSMIIGDSQTGETPNFNVFYYLVKLAVKGRLKALPTMKSALIDMVPSDYAATAMCEIVNHESSIGKTFHLCSGRDRTPTMNEIFELMTCFFSDSHTGPEENTFRCPMMLNPTLYRSIISPVLRMTLPAKKRNRLKNVELYIPYTTARKIFDTSNTAAILDGKELVPPLWKDYYTNIFQFCVDHDWKAERLAV